MVNRSKNKGTLMESLVRDYLIEQGFDARRNPLSGSKDVGDIHVHGIDAIWEIKNCVKLSLSQWVQESEIERQNAGKKWAFTIFKRKGKSKAGEQYALMPLATLVELIKNLK